MCVYCEVEDSQNSTQDYIAYEDFIVRDSSLCDGNLPVDDDLAVQYLIEHLCSKEWELVTEVATEDSELTILLTSVVFCPKCGRDLLEGTDN